jgi:hypothetical protein
VFRWLRILALTTLIMVEEVIKSIHIIEWGTAGLPHLDSVKLVASE